MKDIESEIRRFRSIQDCKISELFHCLDINEIEQFSKRESTDPTKLELNKNIIPFADIDKNDLDFLDKVLLLSADHLFSYFLRTNFNDASFNLVN